jgi:AmmeMemoRadiSam system protein A
MSLQPEASTGSRLHPHKLNERIEFSPEEREQLLALAHQAILSVFYKREIAWAETSAHLSEPRGAFTTLYLRGRLRGCVGYVFPVSPLYRAVAETARGAAFEDSRFPPVTEDEAGELKVSISILSRLKPIQPEEVVIGRHGLLISFAGQRGLLLPQVAVEHGWNCLTFLEQTCRKAGLPSNAWRAGAKLESFTAEIFSDPGL